MADPIIITARFEAADQAWLDGLRREHYPPQRNQVAAHLTLFHQLAPSLADEIDSRLGAEGRGNTILAGRLAGVLRFSRGVAFRVECPELEALRERLAAAFAPMLLPQDASPWRPHVTIQNKADQASAARLHANLTASFLPRPIRIVGLASWHYAGGPWRPIRRYSFSRSVPRRRN